MSADIATELFQEHHLKVFRFARRLVGDPSAAEDVTQEVFLRVVRAISTYRERERAIAWLFRIAVNVVRDELRRQGRRPLPTALEESAIPQVEADAALKHDLNRALREVPEAERIAFLLREVGGLSYEEIGTLQASTPDAVRSRIYRARRFLRTSLRQGAQVLEVER